MELLQKSFIKMAILKNFEALPPDIFLRFEHLAV